MTNKQRNKSIDKLALTINDLTPIVNRILIDAKNNQIEDKCTYLGLKHLKNAIDNYIQNHPNTKI